MQQVFNYSDKLVRVIMINNEPWFVAKDVAEILGFRMASDMTRILEENDKIIYDIHTRIGGIQKMLLINRKGLLNIISKTRKISKDEKRNILKCFGISDKEYIIINSPKETEFINIIKKSFQNYISISQYKIGSYRIDLYFPKLKLAIECDEYGHKNYDKDKEKEREKYIKDKLNCHFIRFNPDKPNFNIGDVIYEINTYINNKIKKEE